MIIAIDIIKQYKRDTYLIKDTSYIFIIQNQLH